MWGSISLVLKWSLGLFFVVLLTGIGSWQNHPYSSSDICNEILTNPAIRASSDPCIQRSFCPVTLVFNDPCIQWSLYPVILIFVSQCTYAHVHSCMADSPHKICIAITFCLAEVLELLDRFRLGNCEQRVQICMHACMHACANFFELNQ